MELIFFDETGKGVMKPQANVQLSYKRDGILLCQCGHFYPIIGNIIRTVNIEARPYKAYFLKFKDILCKLGVNLQPPTLEARVRHAHTSFSYEWKMLKSKSTVWGLTREEMLNNLEKQLLVKNEHMRNMIILDAGSGHGWTTSAFAKLSDNVISLEISESIDLAYKESSDKNNVLFIQGNVMTPPLVDESIDIIYAAGVLHHSPNTKLSAQALMHLLKKQGRFYLWLYPKRCFIYTMVLNFVRFFTSRIPPFILWQVLKISLPLFNLWSKVKSKHNSSCPYSYLSTDDRMIGLFDTYSPKYRHTHYPEEVEQWFKEQNFERTNLLHFNKYNFDMLAIKS